MFRGTRRSVLKAVSGAVAVSGLGSVAGARERVETVIDIPGQQVPENLAIDDDGTLYFGITAGAVRKIDAGATQETGLALSETEQVATLSRPVIGVEVVPDGTVYVASPGGDDSGVWKVPRDGTAPMPVASIGGFPNDVRHDPRHDRLLVSESFGGTVYEVPLDDNPSASVWAQDGRLDTESFGANGLTITPGGAVLVAVTRATNDAGADVGRLVRIPVGDDGSAGEAATYLESPALFGADGITAHGPNVYVAANSRNEVVRVTPEKRVQTVASAGNGLVFPSDVLFGTASRQRGDLFVCNFAIGSPGDAAILRTHP